MDRHYRSRLLPDLLVHPMSEKKLVDDVDCPECGGTGTDRFEDGYEVWDYMCQRCEGNGYIERPNGST